MALRMEDTGWGQPKAFGGSEELGKASGEPSLRPKDTAHPPLCSTSWVTRSEAGAEASPLVDLERAATSSRSVLASSRRWSAMLAMTD